MIFQHYLLDWQNILYQFKLDFVGESAFFAAIGIESPSEKHF